MSDVLYSLSVHGEFIIASIPLYFLLLLEVAKSFKNGDKIAFRSLVVFTIAYAIYALGASYADIVSQSYQDYLIRQDSFGSIIVLNVLLVFVSFLKGNETSR
jgi:hypothetical protein